MIEAQYHNFKVIYKFKTTNTHGRHFLTLKCLLHLLATDLSVWVFPGTTPSDIGPPSRHRGSCNFGDVCGNDVFSSSNPTIETPQSHSVTKLQWQYQKSMVLPHAVTTSLTHIISLLRASMSLWLEKINYLFILIMEQIYTNYKVI